MPKYMLGRPSDSSRTTPDVPVELRMKAFETMIRMQVGRPRSTACRSPTTRSGRRIRPPPTASSTGSARRITPKRISRRLHCDEVEFVDGSRERVDVVVYGTGYRISFPFFDPGFISRRQPDRAVPPGSCTRTSERLFVGLVQPLGATMPIAETQGRWIADNLRGELRAARARRDAARHRGGG